MTDALRDFFDGKPSSVSPIVSRLAILESKRYAEIKKHSMLIIDDAQKMGVAVIIRRCKHYYSATLTVLETSECIGLKTKRLEFLIEEIKFFVNNRK